jgi:hypothetical protein
MRTEIDVNIIFPNNRIEHNDVLELEDGCYDVTGGVPLTPGAYIKNKKLIRYDNYLLNENKEKYLYLIWTFDYDIYKSIYREFPTLGIPKTIFCDINGRK